MNERVGDVYRRFAESEVKGGAPVGLDPASGPSTVQIPCEIHDHGVPAHLPTIVWRAGVDLNPIDPGDQDQVAWLETLVWPEHSARRDRLHAAAALAANDPPHLRQGDLLAVIPDLIGQAPEGANVVVFHSSVLAYLTPERRREFAEMMLALEKVTWVSNEAPGVFPFITRLVSKPIRGRTRRSRSNKEPRPSSPQHWEPFGIPQAVSSEPMGRERGEPRRAP